MSKLSDTQLVILSAACARADRRVLPLPKSLRGGAAKKVIDALIARGFVEEADADLRIGDPVWRDTGDGRHMTLVATSKADAVLDGYQTEAVPASPQRTARALAGTTAAKLRTKVRKAANPAAAPATGKTRPGTKQAQLIAMLKRAKGASIAEIAEALGWQHHTVHGAIAGALRKKQGLTVASEPHETRGRVYRITD